MHPSVERLLQFARKATGNRDLTFAELGSRLLVSPAVMTNWKARGVSKEGAIKAEHAFGCTAHYILSGKHSEREPKVATRPQGEGEPPSPDFTAKEVSESEWALLQDIKVLPETRLNAIRAEAAEWRTITDEIIAKRLASGDTSPAHDNLVGGESQIGDLDTGSDK